MSDETGASSAERAADAQRREAGQNPETGSAVQGAQAAQGGSEGVEERQGHAAQPSPKKNHRKAWTVVGVVAAVIIVAGLGFNAWHNTPGFCNSICHKPMDVYVDTYRSGDMGMLAAAHANANLSCLDCHEAKLTEQITEVMAWTSDDFPMTDDGYLNNDTSQFASKENCLKSGCHDWNMVVKGTWGFSGNDEKYNPHSSHQDGSIECSDCHKSHVKSTLYCAKCHELNLPEGWEATSD